MAYHGVLQSTVPITKYLLGTYIIMNSWFDDTTYAHGLCRIDNTNIKHLIYHGANTGNNYNTVHVANNRHLQLNLR